MHTGFFLMCRGEKYFLKNVKNENVFLILDKKIDKFARVLYNTYDLMLITV